MVICPVALAVGCKKCPVFSICPATRLIGDQKPEVELPAKSVPPVASRPAKTTKVAKRSRRPRRK